MTVDVSSMQTAFSPEFDDVNTALIQTCIDDAVARVGVSAWGSKYDLGVKYLAAHLLSIRAAGQNARLVADLKETIYGREYLFMSRTVSYGGRIASTGYGNYPYWDFGGWKWSLRWH